MIRFYLGVMFVAGIVACSAPGTSSHEGIIPNDRSAAPAKASVTVDLLIANRGAGDPQQLAPSAARVVKFYAYGREAGSYDISATSRNCRSERRGRLCRFAVGAPLGTDRFTAALYGVRGLLGFGSATVTIRGGSALHFAAGTSAATLEIDTPALDNPVAAGQHTEAAALSIGVTASDASGNVVLAGSSSPIVVRVYGPSGLVSVPGYSPAPVPSATVGTDGTANFRYSGGYFANAMTVAAVQGTLSMTAQLFGTNTPQPSSCPQLSATKVFATTQHHVLKTSQNGGGIFTYFSIAGSPKYRVQVDTGSTGFYVSKGIFAKANQTEVIGPGQSGYEILEPSGDKISGHYYLAPVTVHTDSGSATTVPMEVLVIGGTTTKYMGVGFGRPTPPPGTGYLKSPLENVFLQLSDIVTGTMHPGYILTKNLMQIGINKRSANGYAMTGLSPFSGREGDWQSPPGCMQFNGGSYQCGSMLLDVGIDEMFVTNFSTPSPLNSIAIGAPNSSSTSLSYSFTYPVPASATPPAPNPAGNPAPVIFSAPGGTPFLNTGRFALAAAGYLYDAGCGRVGFKP